MTSPSSNVGAIRFGRFAPTLSVANVSAAEHFYVDLLGFEKKFENGEPVGFMILRKDDAELHITLNPSHKATTHNVAHLMVDDAKALYDHCISRGIRVIKGLRDAEYGSARFRVCRPRRESDRCRSGPVIRGLARRHAAGWLQCCSC